MVLLRTPTPFLLLPRCAAFPPFESISDETSLFPPQLLAPRGEEGDLLTPLFSHPVARFDEFASVSLSGPISAGFFFWFLFPKTGRPRPPFSSFPFHFPVFNLRRFFCCQPFSPSPPFCCRLSPLTRLGCGHPYQ